MVLISEQTPPRPSFYFFYFPFSSLSRLSLGQPPKGFFSDCYPKLLEEGEREVSQCSAPSTTFAWEWSTKSKDLRIGASMMHPQVYGTEEMAPLFFFCFCLLALSSSRGTQVPRLCTRVGQRNCCLTYPLAGWQCCRVVRPTQLVGARRDVTYPLLWR